jgi:hypothetical protein
VLSYYHGVPDGTLEHASRCNDPVKGLAQKTTLSRKRLRSSFEVEALGYERLNSGEQE